MQRVRREPNLIGELFLAGIRIELTQHVPFALRQMIERFPDNFRTGQPDHQRFEQSAELVRQKLQTACQLRGKLRILVAPMNDEQESMLSIHDLRKDRGTRGIGGVGTLDLEIGVRIFAKAASGDEYGADPVQRMPALVCRKMR